MNRFASFIAAVFFAASALFAQSVAERFARDPKQPVDQWYTERIQKYTTGPALNSPRAQGQTAEAAR